MKRKKKELIFVFLFLAVAFSMLLYSLSTESFRITSKEEAHLSLNQKERRFIAQKKEVILKIDNELSYFDTGFLETYLADVFAPSGLKVKVIKNAEKKADASLVLVNKSYRSQTDTMQFTAPLFRITGSLFIRTGVSKDPERALKGVSVKSQFSKEEKKTLSYNGESITLQETESIKKAVDLAEKGHFDCILGDQTAISRYLERKGMQDEYKNTFAELYKNNVCIMTEQTDSLLYSILNQCIQNADLTILMGQAQERWFGISDTLVQEDRYQDATTLLMIVFAAVFCTFFFYYQSNKNLYNELTDRMNQLTASKQEMQTTFNGVSYYMAELDSQGFILDINKAFLNYVNCEPLGKHIANVLDLPEVTQTILEDMLKQTNDTGRGTSKEITLKRNILEVNIFPILNAKNEVEKLLFMAGDVTSERMAERQMLQDNKMIAVGQLAAGVAHEIRNPLGIIRNYCYVLKSMKDEESQAQAVQVIEKSVDTAGNIIDNLLNFSRISKKKIGKVHIKEHIDSVIALNKGMLKKKAISVFIQCERDFQVQMAVESFDMIFINLVSNAIDAMSSQGKLMIAIEEGEAEFFIEVTDTGTGIDEEILGDIFNPFFTTKSSTKGNGLGLYIVYNEIQKMNGKIQVRSKLGAGTTFKVALPLKVRAEEEDSSE